MMHQWAHVMKLLHRVSLPVALWTSNFLGHHLVTFDGEHQLNKKTSWVDCGRRVVRIGKVQQSHLGSKSHYQLHFSIVCLCSPDISWCHLAPPSTGAWKSCIFNIQQRKETNIKWGQGAYPWAANATSACKYRSQLYLVNPFSIFWWWWWLRLSNMSPTRLKGQARPPSGSKLEWHCHIVLYQLLDHNAKYCLCIWFQNFL